MQYLSLQFLVGRCAARSLLSLVKRASRWCFRLVLSLLQYCRTEMKFFVALAFGLLVTACLSLRITPKAGIKPDGQLCTAPMQCLEPFYCLKVNETAHACGLKACQGQGQCRIGQFCDGSGHCAVASCVVNSECSGETICQVNGKCGTKSNNGQGCHRDDQCWSKTCVDDKCVPAGAASTSETEPEPTPVSDDGLIDGAADVIKRGIKIGGGAIAGISVGVLALLALCCLCIMCCRCKRDGDD